MFALRDADPLATPYLEITAGRPPTFRPWTTPAYADNGFALLGLALANTTTSAPSPGGWCRPSPMLSTAARLSASSRPSIALARSRPSAAPLFSGPSFEAADWIYADVLTYGGVGATLFVFDVGCDGKATAISPAAFRMTLQKVWWARVKIALVQLGFLLSFTV